MNKAAFVTSLIFFFRGLNGIWALFVYKITPNDVCGLNNGSKPK